MIFALCFDAWNYLLFVKFLSFCFDQADNYADMSNILPKGRETDRRDRIDKRNARHSAYESLPNQTFCKHNRLFKYYTYDALVALKLQQLCGTKPHHYFLLKSFGPQPMSILKPGSTAYPTVPVKSTTYSLNVYGTLTLKVSQHLYGTKQPTIFFWQRLMLQAACGWTRPLYVTIIEVLFG